MFKSKKPSKVKKIINLIMLCFALSLLITALTYKFTIYENTIKISLAGNKATYNITTLKDISNYKDNLSELNNLTGNSNGEYNLSNELKNTSEIANIANCDIEISTKTKKVKLFSALSKLLKERFKTNEIQK